MQKKEKNIKEAQGRKSRQLGKLNRAKILTLLSQYPLTFKRLEEEKLFSTPILSKHLKTLMEEGLIQKAVRGNEIVYQVVSKEEVTNEVASILIFLLGYIFGKLSPKTITFIENVTKEELLELEEVRE